MSHRSPSTATPSARARPRRRAARSLAAVVAVTALAAAAGTYVVAPGDTLSGIAQTNGTTISEIAAANDISDPDRIVIGQRLHLPDGASGSASGSAGPAAGGARTATHTVRPGETLSAIAARFGVPVAELAAANGITDPQRVLAGSRLRVGDLPAAAAALKSVSSRVGRAASHRVEPGQTLSGIAARYGVTVADLAAANGIDDPDRVRAGDTLAVPGGWTCPVVSGLTFVDDYGYVKPSGRAHEGIDLFAPRGTDVVAPVGGVARQVEGSRGGLQVWLEGDDGARYIASHLDSLATAGRVSAGTVVGTVGTSGNAANTSPHVHFEMSTDGINVNPYALLADACR